MAYASSSASLGSMSCQIRVGRCAPDPHVGALRTVEGPIVAIMCAGRGDLTGLSHMNPIPPIWVEAR